MHPLVRTARVTGLFYLGLAVFGGLSFLAVRPMLLVDNDGPATLSNLVEHQQLARLGIGLELLTVLTQALVAVWFFRLFRPVDRVGAASIAAFGLVNATAVLGSAAALATALDLALDGADQAAAGVQLLYGLSTHLWGVGALFFGLWLIPMGTCVVRSGWLPRLLGWALIVGGLGYVVSVFVKYLIPGAWAVADAFAYLSVIGEFWIVGYLLILGVRRSRLDGVPRPARNAHIG